MAYEKLFSPLKIRGVELRNRVVLPAMMTKMTTNEHEGIVSDKLVDYHAAIAKGGCGLNITEVMAVHPSTHGYAYCALYEEKHEAGVKKMIDAVHANGGKMCVQLWHGGRTVNAMLALLGDEYKGGKRQAIMQETVNDIPVSLLDEIVEAFGVAAQRAVRLGADVLEYHTAHMYLGHTFMSRVWNQRTDEYGGSLENRARFVRRVIQEIRKNMPEDMPLFMRIDVHDDFVGELGLTTEEVAQVLTWVHEDGVDVADVSRGNGCTPALRYEVPTMDTPNGFNLPDVKALKALLPPTMKVMAVGRINTGALAEKALEDGICDLVAMGRAQIADHDFVNKHKEGREDEIRRCIACNKGCFDAVMDKRMPHMMCTRNLKVGRLDRPVRKVDASEAKTVLIAGGGLAGLTAAQLLKTRGHNPILCEAKGELGGQMNLAKALPYKYEWVNMINWEIENTKKAGVDIRLNTPVTAELVAEIKPDHVIVATGAHAPAPVLEGADAAKVCTYEDILSGKVAPAGNVVVIGATQYGCEATQACLEKGIKPVVLEAGPMMAMDAGWLRGFNLMVNIPMAGVKCVTSCTVTGVTASEISYKAVNRDKTEVTDTIPYDLVILGNKPVANPFADVEAKCGELGIPCHIVGDAKQVESVLWAANQAADVALDVI
ncbi:MAG: FAD-dependent oxidoreductase [Oscillospiraceae bacterium]|nr:FAD-dependent oxidoreductase [Oscillospiraceae bacterium]